MGIGTTVKNMLSNQDSTGVHEGEERVSGLDRTSNANYDNNLVKDPTRRASYKLPSGTGPGTSGKPLSESAMEHDIERSKFHGASGYGTDAAAATGGSLVGTHQGSRAFDSRTTGVVGNASSDKKNSLSGQTGYSPDTEARRYANDVESDLNRRRTTDSDRVGRSGLLDSDHRFGHSKISARDSMPTGETQEDTNQLNPVTHQHIRHIETEEVERVKDHERHIHHIQHHTQPIIATEELAEQHRDFAHPVTRIEGKHANKVEDNALFEGQIRQHQDTLRHGAKERSIIDKGTTVNEHVHHHVHHVIQPVIEKEIVEKHRIHTTIPIHEVTHEAPVIHQSQTHAPVPMEHFIQRGGALQGAVSRDEIGRKVLHGGQCTREVDGIAETIERDLNLSKSHVHNTRDDDAGITTTTKTTQRTTVATDSDQGAALHTGRNL